MILLFSALCISILLNIYLYKQFRKEKKNSYYESSWKEKLNLNNKINALIWAWLTIILFLCLVGLFSGIDS